MSRNLLFSEVPHQRIEYKNTMNGWVNTQMIYRFAAIFSLCLIIYMAFFERNIGKGFLYMLLVILFINTIVLEFIWYHYLNCIVGHIIDIFDDGVVIRYKTKETFYPKEEVAKVKVDGKREEILIKLKDKDEPVIIKKRASKIKGDYIDNMYKLEEATEKLNIYLEIIYP